MNTAKYGISVRSTHFISTTGRGCQKEKGEILLLLTISVFLLCKSKVVARKQGPCAQKASAGKEFAHEISSALPQNEAGA